MVRYEFLLSFRLPYISRGSKHFLDITLSYLNYTRDWKPVPGRKEQERTRKEASDTNAQKSGTAQSGTAQSQTAQSRTAQCRNAHLFCQTRPLTCAPQPNACPECNRNFPLTKRRVGISACARRSVYVCVCVQEYVRACACSMLCAFTLRMPVSLWARERETGTCACFRWWSPDKAKWKELITDTFTK